MLKNFFQTFVIIVLCVIYCRENEVAEYLGRALELLSVFWTKHVPFKIFITGIQIVAISAVLVKHSKAEKAVQFYFEEWITLSMTSEVFGGKRFKYSDEYKVSTCKYKVFTTLSMFSRPRVHATLL